MSFAQEIRQIFNKSILGTGVRVARFPESNAVGIALADGAAGVFGAAGEIAAKTKVGATGTRYRIVGAAVGTFAAGGLTMFHTVRLRGVIAGVATAVIDFTYVPQTAVGAYGAFFFPDLAICTVDNVASDIDALVATSAGGVGAGTVSVAALAATGIGT